MTVSAEISDLVDFVVESGTADVHNDGNSAI